jgi:hypothetical protein
MPKLIGNHFNRMINLKSNWHPGEKWVASCNLMPKTRLGIMLAALLVGAVARGAEPAPEMEHRGHIKGLQGSYISVVHRDGKYYFFGNVIGESTPGLTLSTGETPQAVGPGEVIAPNALIDDLTDASGQPDPTRMITRPSVRFSEKEQRYYAIIHVARGYPPADGRCYPALLVSKTANPKGGWVYKGQFKGEPAALYGPPKRSWTSGMAFLLNDQPSATIDHARPLANKLVLYNEFGGHGNNLLYSNAGIEWFFYRDSEKKIVEFMPKEFAEDVTWCFSSVAQTPDGYFMYISSRWTKQGPAGHRFLYSKDGLAWKQIKAYPLGPKNFSIFYDAEKNLLYIMPTIVNRPPYGKDLYVMTPRPFD